MFRSFQQVARRLLIVTRMTVQSLQVQAPLPASYRRKRLKAKGLPSLRLVLLAVLAVCLLLKFSLGHHGGKGARDQRAELQVLNLHLQQLAAQAPPSTPCHVLVISTFPPRKCGIAQFTQLKLDAMRRVETRLPSAWQCRYSVLALDDTDDMDGYDAELVIRKVVKDREQPGMSFWNASRWILGHQERSVQLVQQAREEQLPLAGLPKESLPFTHMLTQLEFGIVWHKWQLLDLVRWTVAAQREMRLPIGDLQSVLVCHSPFAYPHIEEKGFVRHLVDHSSAIIAMSWHGYHSLITAYGVPEEKVFFIPHGVNLPNGGQEARPLQTPPRLQPGEAPDLTTLEHLMSLPEGHPERPLLLLSHGLIHPNKGFHRIVRNLRHIVDRVAGQHKVALLFLGMEHSKDPEKHIMPALLEEATKLGVRQHITWHSAYSSQSDLSKWLSLSDIYFSLYEEIAPTSGALLQAMAHGCAIVATGYRFASEVLTAQRGLVVPFEDDAQIQAAFLLLLRSPETRQRLGENAARFAQQWTWDQVAGQYRMLFAALQASTERQNVSAPATKYFIPPVPIPPAFQPLTPDPFDMSYHLDSALYAAPPEATDSAQEFAALWAADRIVTFHGINLHSGSAVLEGQQLERGVYSLYADKELQVNGLIRQSDSYALSKVALRWQGVRIVADSESGVKVEGHTEGVRTDTLSGKVSDKWSSVTAPITLFTNRESRPLQRRHLLGDDSTQFYHGVVLQTGQVTVTLSVRAGQEVIVALQDASRFDHPHGLLGQTLRCAWDLPARTSGACPAVFRKELYLGVDMASLNPDVWLVAGSQEEGGVAGALWSSNCPGQRWEIWSVYFNEVEEDQLWLKGAEFKYVPR